MFSNHAKKKENLRTKKLTTEKENKVGFEFQIKS